MNFAEGEGFKVFFENLDLLRGCLCTVKLRKVGVQLRVVEHYDVCLIQFQFRCVI